MKWLDEPEDHDYDAAASFLSLMFDPAEVREIVARLRKAKVGTWKAKDVWRASGVTMLPATNRHVAKDLKKDRLSPVLLVHGHPLIIADGYHRVCAVYNTDEDADVYGKLV